MLSPSVIFSLLSLCFCFFCSDQASQKNIDVWISSAVPLRDFVTEVFTAAFALQRTLRTLAQFLKIFPLRAESATIDVGDARLTQDTFTSKII